MTCALADTTCSKSSGTVLGTVGINLDQIRTVELGENHCKLRFDATFTVDLHGQGANELIGFLGSRSVSVNGEPIADIFDRIDGEEAAKN